MRWCKLRRERESPKSKKLETIRELTDHAWTIKELVERAAKVMTHNRFLHLAIATTLYLIRLWFSVGTIIGEILDYQHFPNDQHPMMPMRLSFAVPATVLFACGLALNWWRFLAKR